jgi:electron transport complex protein RnfC
VDTPPDQLAAWPEYVAAAGLGADRVGSPDLAGQLAGAAGVRVIVCNALESSPAAVQGAVLVKHAADVARALARLATLCGGRRRAEVVVAAEPEVCGRVRGALRGKPCRAKVVPLRPVYPQQHPTALLWTLKRLRLPPEKLPTTAGVLLIDAVAALRIGQALAGQPHDEVPIAVAGRLLTWVKVGTPLGEVLPTEPTLWQDDARRQVRADPDELAGPGAVAFDVTTETPAAPPRSCVRCGWCCEVCPTHLHPAALLDAAQHRDPAAARRLHVGSCIECGLCDKICPSDLPLLDAIRQVRDG